VCIAKIFPIGCRKDLIKNNYVIGLNYKRKKYTFETIAFQNREQTGFSKVTLCEVAKQIQFQKIRIQQRNSKSWGVNGTHLGPDNL